MCVCGSTLGYEKLLQFAYLRFRLLGCRAGYQITYADARCQPLMSSHVGDEHADPTAALVEQASSMSSPQFSHMHVFVACLLR